MSKALSLMAAAVVAMGLSVSLAQAESRDSVFHAHMAVGDVIPEATVLHLVPDAVVATSPELAAHGFYVANDYIHVIHPDTRAVVAVIDHR